MKKLQKKGMVEQSNMVYLYTSEGGKSNTAQSCGGKSNGGTSCSGKTNNSTGC